MAYQIGTYKLFDDQFYFVNEFQRPDTSNDELVRWRKCCFPPTLGRSNDDDIPSSSRGYAFITLWAEQGESNTYQLECTCTYGYSNCYCSIDGFPLTNAYSKFGTHGARDNGGKLL